MANEEVLGPRKTMFVLVIVVGCFAVLWPRILSPLILGHTREQLKPNQFDREAALKQERPLIRGAGPHPALRERGRAIPPGTPSPPRPPVTMPPHARVRTSPLSVYYELDIKPPPIPGMRPPLGSPGGPVAAPKSSMGFVMPVYTICIIVFFVYTLSKILFKRGSSSPYESVDPDPQFRRRVFRDDSRTSPDKLGPKERDTIVTAISGLVAEVREQMEASYAQNQQRQDLQDNHARPYTNGTVLHNSGPVQIVASEYREQSKEKSPAPTEPQKESVPEPAPEPKESTPEPKEPTPEKKEPTLELETSPERGESPARDEISPEHDEASPEREESSPQHDKPEPEPEDIVQNALLETKDDLIKFTELERPKEYADEVVKSTKDFLDKAREVEVVSAEEFEEKSKEDRATPDLLQEALKEDSSENDMEDGADDDHDKPSVKVVGMETTAHAVDGREYRPPPARAPPAPAARAHEAEEVKSIFLESPLPQQGRVLVAEFQDDARPQAKHSPTVVSGKMTLSLIQDAPRDTPERDLESTVDDFTTASGVTQPAAEKEDEELSGEEIEEEIEIEEIEEEVEDEEEEEPQKAEPQKPTKAQK